MEIPDLNIEVLTSPEQVSEFLTWLTKPGRWYLACDVETTGLNQFVPGFHTRLIQFGDGEGGWAVPFQQWTSLCQWVFDWCSKHRITMVWHNVVYDAQALAVEGFKLDFTIQADTFVLAGLGGFCEQTRALKPLGVKHLGPWAKLWQDVLHDGMKNAGWTWETVPIGWQPFPLYGVLDTCITALLWEKWQPRYEKWREMHDLEIAAIDMVNGMARRGMPVDIPYLTEQQGLLSARRTKVQTWFTKEYGFSPSQNNKLGELLTEAGVVPPDAPITASGHVSTEAEVLARINHKAAKAVLAYRNSDLLLTRYVNKLIEFADSDGLVHAGIQPMKAKTSRMSIERPALQQIPSSDTLVRKGILGRMRKDGMGRELTLSSDYSQIELRLWGMPSMHNDEALVAAIKKADLEGPDFFTALCRSIYNEPMFEKSDSRRTKVKSATYAKLFDGGIEVAAGTAGVSVGAMLPIWLELGNAFPSMKESGKDDVKITGDAAYLMSPFGRRFACADKSQFRKIPNWRCQGSAAIALKKAMVGARAAGLEEFLTLPVHDELLGSVPQEQSEDVVNELREVMSSIVTEAEFGINVPAEPAVGANWNEVH